MTTQTPTTVPAYVPRADVGAAGISGVLATVVMMVLNNDGIYNFDAVYALIFGLAVAAAGYMVPRNKSFVMLVAAPLATLVAAVLGKVLYNVEWDNAAVSAALASFTVAFFGYAIRPRLPDADAAVVESPANPDAPTQTRVRRETP